MKYTAVGLAVVMGMGLVSCNENEPAKPAKSTFFDSLQKGGTVTYSPNMPNQPITSNQPAVTPLAPAPGSAMDLSGMTLATKPQGEKPPVEPTIQIPADARWTIYCTSVAGPDRFARIGRLKASLIERSGMTDWYVVHNEQDSTLFYGFYSSVDREGRGSVRAHAEQKQIQELKTDLQDRLFARCFFTPIVQPDPAAPAEWKLTNAPAKAFWSLEIAAFKDNVLRKQAAVEMVKQLRDKGVEAYFFHGDSISSVCVGTWPMEAVEKQDMDKGRSVDSEDDVLVSPVELPEQYQKAKMTNKRDGHKIRAYTQKIEIADPSLKAVMAQYPEHYVNYDLYKSKVRTTKGTDEMLAAPSFLVKIPGAENRLLNGGDGPAAASSLLNQVGAPLPPPPSDPMLQRGTGRLRGLGN